LIVPNAHCLTAEQIDAIRRVRDTGQGVLWIGNVAERPWGGSGPCPPPRIPERGEFRLEFGDDHPLTVGLQRPVMLGERVAWDGPEGMALGTVAGRPGLVICEGRGGREAWLTGLPMHSWRKPGLHGAHRTPAGGVELLRRLVLWLAPEAPLARLTPFPPDTEYGRHRPWDVRDVPTAELLPMHTPDSVLAIVFPYLAVAYETSLLVCPPAGRAVRSAEDLWSREDLTDRLQRSEDGSARLPLVVPGECELLAIGATF
jgi:hypothetical protein